MTNKSHKTLAEVFNESASSTLHSLMFELNNDPHRNYSPHGASKAIYKQPNGFYLGIWFDPIEGGCAGIDCGRSFSLKNDFYGLSTSLSELADQIGISIPRFYSIDKHLDANALFKTILADLSSHLPKITASTSLSMLEGLESKPWSAPGRLKSFYPNATKDIVVSEYTQARS